MSMLESDTSSVQLAVGLSQPVAMSNHDGRLEVFAAGSDGAVWHKWQKAPNGGWSGWANLGKPNNQEAGRVLAAANQDGRLELFVPTTNAIYHMWQQSKGGWSGWASLGADPGNGLVSATIGRNHDGRLEIFAAGGTVAWHRWQVVPNGGWSGWTNLGRPSTAFMGGSMTTELNADGHLELFATAKDSTVVHNYRTKTGWSGWSHLGAVLLSSGLTAARNIDGRLELFSERPSGTTTHATLWHIWQTAPNSGWSGWVMLDDEQNLDTFIGSGGIDAAANRDGRLEVFALEVDAAVGQGRLVHWWQLPQGGWSGRQAFGTRNLKGGLSVARNADGRLEAFVVRHDNVILHTWQTSPNSGWSGLVPL